MSKFRVTQWEDCWQRVLGGDQEAGLLQKVVSSR